MPLGAILALSIAFCYTLVGIGVYRRVYVLRMREFLRWQNEAPYQQHQYQVYGNDVKPREKFSFQLWMQKIDKRDYPSEIAFLWIFYAIGYPIYRVCHPEVKIPSVTKIQELEKL